MSHVEDAEQTWAFEEILRRRYSCRAFAGQVLSQKTMERLLALAQQAPSWCNVQPWHVYVLSGQAVSDLSGLLLASSDFGSAEYDIDPVKEYTGVYKERRRATGSALYQSVGIERDEHEKRRDQSLENFRFFGAPHVAIVTCDSSLGDYAYVDTGAYLSHFILAASSLGVDTIVQASIASRSGVVRSALNVPDTQLIVAAVSLGRGIKDHPANGFRTNRASTNESSTWLDSIA